MKYRVTVLEKSISRIEYVVEADSPMTAEQHFHEGDVRNRELVDGCVEQDIISVEEEPNA